MGATYLRRADAPNRHSAASWAPRPHSSGRTTRHQRLEDCTSSYAEAAGPAAAAAAVAVTDAVAVDADAVADAAVAVAVAAAAGAGCYGGQAGEACQHWD